MQVNANNYRQYALSNEYIGWKVAVLQILLASLVSKVFFHLPM
jgi:hypothetical protein